MNAEAIGLLLGPLTTYLTGRKTSGLLLSETILNMVVIQYQSMEENSFKSLHCIYW